MAECKCLIHRSCPLHQAARKLLRELEAMLDHYLDLVSYGGCGGEEEEHVRSAREAIAEACPERRESEARGESC